MAAFCWAWRLSPSEYWALTVSEHAAMVDFVNDLADKRGG